MPNFYPECGKKIEGAPKFCDQCGHSFQESARPSDMMGKKRPNYPWLFPGAFANYYGKSIFEDIQVNTECLMHLEVTEIDQIGERVKLQAKTRMRQQRRPNTCFVKPRITDTGGSTKNTIGTNWRQSSFR